MHVSPDARLDYRLEVADVETLTARLAAASLSITLPRRLAEPWYADGEVSVEGEQLCGDGRRLNILVEKDFACLIPREGEDQSDLFSNPAQA